MAKAKKNGQSVVTDSVPALDKLGLQIIGDEESLLDALLTLAKEGEEVELPDEFVRLHSKGIFSRRFFATNVETRMCDSDTVVVGALWSPALRLGILVADYNGMEPNLLLGCFAYNGDVPVFSEKILENVKQLVFQDKNGNLGAPEEFINYAPEFFPKQLFVDYYKRYYADDKDLSNFSYEEESLDSVEM